MQLFRSFSKKMALVLLLTVFPMSATRCGTGLEMNEPQSSTEELQALNLDDLEKITPHELVERYGNIGPVRIIMPTSPVRSFSAPLITPEQECHAELLGCMRGCMSPLKPGSSKEEIAYRHSRCNEMCMKQYMVCINAISNLAVFATVGAAFKWIANNADVLLVGAVLVVGTGALIFVSDGAGVTLVPYANYLMQQYMQVR